jgi:hypothetical protein
MMKQNFILMAGVLIIVLVLVAPVSADTLTANSVTSQNATVGTAVAAPPSVKVVNGSIPVSGVVITFAVTNGGGTLTGGTATTTATTGADGIATVGSWTLGTTAGSNTMTATNNSLMGSPLTFTATGTAGLATQMANTTVTSQSAPAGTAVTAPPTVIVKDAYNNPVSGATVAFQVISGGGTPGSTSVTTGANGIATVGSWTLGQTAGINHLTATSTGLTGSPVNFYASGMAASAPTITGISPSNGYNTTDISPVQITGSGFSTSGGSVNLTRSGETNITGACSWGTTIITCSFPITGKTAGAWNVVVTNADGQTVTTVFTINSPSSSPTLTSITPSNGEVNTTVSITNLAGTNFASGASIRLKRSGYNPIVGTATTMSSTQIVGTFNLNNQVPGNYEVCVYNDANTYVCGLTFTITSPGATATNSSVYFQTNPSGATVWVNKVKVGTSPFTYYNATPGTQPVLIQMSGYRDYTGYVTVQEGKRVSFYAQLQTPVETGTTAATTAPTVKTTATTIKKSTLKLPTTWPSATPTPESPIDPAIVIGAVGIGLGLVAIRRR